MVEEQTVLEEQVNLSTVFYTMLIGYRMVAPIRLTPRRRTTRRDETDIEIEIKPRTSQSQLQEAQLGAPPRPTVGARIRGEALVHRPGRQPQFEDPLIVAA